MVFFHEQQTVADAIQFLHSKKPTFIDMDRTSSIYGHAYTCILIYICFFAVHCSWFIAAISGATSIWATCPTTSHPSRKRLFIPPCSRHARHFGLKGDNFDTFYTSARLRPIEAGEAEPIAAHLMIAGDSLASVNWRVRYGGQKGEEEIGSPVSSSSIFATYGTFFPPRVLLLCYQSMSHPFLLVYPIFLNGTARSIKHCP